ncbi:MAG: hypothetical protein F6K24_44610, partial [Okeania sp. SIO2D1]|nr:hypothetical protein [Okeania sp. SIO2D1]
CLNLSDRELNDWETEVLSRTVKWSSYYKIYHHLEKGNFDEVFKLCELLENWRSKSVKLSISVKELGTRIQKILQANSRLKFEVDEYRNWVKNLENKNLALEMKINQLNDEKKWLESQIKAWMQTAQKYYQENRK